MRDEDRVLDAIHHHLTAVFSTFGVSVHEAVHLVEQVLTDLKAEADVSGDDDVDDLFDAIEAQEYIARDGLKRPESTPADSSIFRRYKRFPVRRAVRLLAAGDERVLTTRDISESGLFVETDTPPPLGETVQVTLETEGGELRLEARVVRITEDGVGLDLSRPEDERLEKLRAVLEHVADPPRPQRETITEEEAELTLEIVDQSDLYAALKMAPDAPAALLVARINARLSMFDEDLPGGSQRHALRGALERFRALCQHPGQRLAYDFFNGHCDAERRLARGDDPLVMRGVWSRVYPERVGAALESAREANQCAQRGEFERAIKLTEDAIDDDPFHLQLRAALEKWGAIAPLASAMRDNQISRARSLAGEMSVDELRHLWSVVHPGRIERAKSHARRAMQHVGKAEFNAAIEIASQAAELDPFNVNLPSAIERWKADVSTSGERP